MNDLKRRLEDEFAASGKKATALIREIDSGEILYEKDADRVVPSASLIKVPILLAVLHDVTEGKYGLDTPVPVREMLPRTTVFEYGPVDCKVIELLHWMIINSDNVATNALIDFAGMDQIDSYMTETLGLKETRLRRRMLDQAAREAGRENTLTHREMETVFEKLFHGEILDPERREVAHTVLARQRKQDQFMRYLYDVQMEHKTGSLKGLNADSGVLFLNGKRYYLGCTVYDQTTPEPDRALCGRFAKIFCETV